MIQKKKNWFKTKITYSPTKTPTHRKAYRYSCTGSVYSSCTKRPQDVSPPRPICLKSIFQEIKSSGSSSALCFEVTGTKPEAEAAPFLPATKSRASISSCMFKISGKSWTLTWWVGVRERMFTHATSKMMMERKGRKWLWFVFIW